MSQTPRPTPESRSDDRLRAVLDPVPTDWDIRPGLRLAAVLAAWFTRDDEDHLLFIRRRLDLPAHPGQIAFPGGAREGCESPTECALRESEEEVGLPPDRVDLLGSVPPRNSSSGYWVHTLVGRIPAAVELRADPREVAEILSFPVRRLGDPTAWELRPPGLASHRRPSPHFDHRGYTLWGLTGLLTRELLERLSAAND